MLLEVDDPYSAKLLDPKKNIPLFEELESQFPVLILFDLSNKSKEVIYSNKEKGTIFDMRSKEDIPSDLIKYILVPTMFIEEAKRMTKERKGLKILPLEVIEMLRSVLHKFGSV